MDHPRRPPRGAEVGGVTHVKKDKNAAGPAFDGEYNPVESHTLPEFPVPENPAYVGIQLSAGMTLPFGRQKLSATAWITIPVENTPEAIEDGFELAYTLCEDQVNARLDEAAATFFPNTPSSEQED